MKKCPNREYECTQRQCGFKSRRAEFLKHIVESHEVKLVEEFDKNMAKKEEETK